MSLLSDLLPVNPIISLFLDLPTHIGAAYPPVAFEKEKGEILRPCVFENVIVLLHLIATLAGYRILE